MGRAFTSFFLFLVFILLIWAVNYGLYMTLNAGGYFDIKEIRVTGNSLLNSDVVIKTCGLKPGMGIFDFNPGDAAARIQNNIVIDSVLVKRVPPDRVEIDLKEKKPIAVVTDHTNYFICDRTGVVLAQGIISNYPEILTGPLMINNDGRISNAFIAALLGNMPDSAGLSNIREIDIKPDSGVYMTMRDTGGTLYFLGKTVPDRSIFDKAETVASKILANCMKIGYVDINNDNAIGFINGPARDNQ